MVVVPEQPLDNEPRVILVDANDAPQGTMPKLAAHQQGLLHRAFSVLVLNDRSEMLLHQRAADKYHAAGLWTNACCSHPAPGETTLAAAKRRMVEEMGVPINPHFVLSLTYRLEMANGLIEHEFDHVYEARLNTDPRPNADEVQDWAWVPLDALADDLRARPERYTPWFRLIFPRWQAQRTHVGATL